MNCWPDGTEMTTEDRIALAIQVGKLRREDVGVFMKDGHKFPHSRLIDWTTDICFDMMCEGKLVLRTRIRSEVERAAESINAHNESFHFLTKGKFLNDDGTFKHAGNDDAGSGSVQADGPGTQRSALVRATNVPSRKSGQSVRPRTPNHRSPRRAS